MRPSFCLHLTLVLLALVCLAGCGKKAQRPASVLNDKDRAVLETYEKIRAALASDDLRTAKRAADQLAQAIKPGAPTGPSAETYEAAKTLTESVALDRAREAFKNLSADVIRRAGDVSGYYVMTCPMSPNGDWLQTNDKVDNPYMGKAMHDCGNIKR